MYQMFIKHLLRCKVQQVNGRKARCPLSQDHIPDRGGGQPTRNKIISDGSDATERKVKAEGGEVTCLRSHSKQLLFPTLPALF